MRLFPICYITMLIFLFSCRKEDPVYPEISITYPTENSTFMTGDTIKVRVSANAEKNINYLKLSLLNSSNTNLSAAQYFHPAGTNNTEHEFDFILGTQTLPSGEYNLVAEVSSDGLSSKDYIKIGLQTTPRRSLGYFIFTGQNGNQSKIYYLDSSGTEIHFATTPGDMTNGYCHSRNMQVVCIGHMSGAFNVFSFPEAEIVFSIPVIPDPPFPYYEGLYCSENNYFISLSEGRIKCYNPGGVLIGDHGYQPYKTLNLITIGEKSYAVQYNNMSTPKRLAEIYTSTGYIISSQQIFFDPVKLLALSNNKIAIVANKNSQGIIYLLDTYNMSLTAQNLNYPDMVFTDAVSIDQNQLLISGDSNLFVYTPASYSLAIFSTLVKAKKLAFDSENQKILCANGKEVIWLNITGNTIVDTKIFSDSVKSIDVMYNY